MSEPVLPNLQDDDFCLLGLPAGFALDRDALDARWKALQRQVHPDRFAAQGAAAQRVAMQWSVRVNEAYQRLKDPLKRAAYWCELQGVPIQAEQNTQMPLSFLQQQMEWREALEDADQDLALLTALDAQVQAAHRQCLDRLAQTIDADQDALAAAQIVRSLMFVERFLAELGQRLDAF